jgi:hypothetical protein
MKAKRITYEKPSLINLFMIKNILFNFILLYVIKFFYKLLSILYNIRLISMSLAYIKIFFESIK